MLEDLDFDFEGKGRFFRVADSKYCSVDVDTLMYKWTYRDFVDQEYWVDMKEDLESVQEEDRRMIEEKMRKMNK